MNAAKTTTTRRAPDAPDCTPEDAAAYSAFYDKHYRMHVRVFCHVFPRLSREEVEDLVASTYTVLWRDWPKVRGQPDKAIRAWVDRAARNRGIDIYRRKKMILNVEYTRDELYTLSNAARRAEHSGIHQGEEADLLALITEYVAAHDAATDPERWTVAREELMEVIAGLCETVGGERMCRTMLAEALGYTLAEIGAVQGRTGSAVKMDLMRARQRIGAPTKGHNNRVPTRYTVTIRKGVAA